MKHHRTSIAEWGEPGTNYHMMDHPILEAYITSRTTAHSVDLYHLLKKLKVIGYREYTNI